MVQRVLDEPVDTMLTVPVGVPVPGETALTDPTVKRMVWPETRLPIPDAGATVKLLTVVESLATVKESDPIDGA